MRIGMDIRKELDGGIGRYIRNLLRGLANSEDISTVHVWAKPDSRILKEETDHLEPHVERARLYGLWEQVALSRKVRRVPVDLFHAPHYIVPVSMKIPLIVTIHDIIHIVFPKSLPHKQFAILQMKYAISHARVIITPSSFTERELRRYFPEAAGKTISIPHGLEPSFFEAPSGEDERIKKTLGLPERYLFYVGNHKPHKNLGQLLEICRDIFHEIPDLYLCVTGESSDEGGRLFEAVTRLGLGDRVRFLGTLGNEALRSCYRNASCFVFPSLYEGFGFPPLEAMACGTPVVAFNVASLPEVVGEGGILVPPGDKKGFHDAVLTLLKGEEARKAWIERGRVQAGKFRWKDAVAAHIAAYREALSR